jgi:putative ABC transport system substrate-binding protein
VGALLFALCSSAEAQQVKKVYRIGILQRSALPASLLEAFKRGMREHGYVEGQNIVIVNLGTDGSSESSAAELARQGMDVIVATGTGAVPGCQERDQDHSHRHVTRRGRCRRWARREPRTAGGKRYRTPDLTGKRLELFKEAVPKIVRIAGVYPLGTRSTALPLWLKDTEAGANALGLRFQKLGLEEDARTWDDAFKQLAKAPRIALVVIENARLIAQRIRIADLAVRHRLPTMFSVKEHVEAGGLLSYGPDLIDVHYRAATFVDKILKGRQPADLPVEQPTKFEFVINLKAAKQIGLTIPPNVLVRADRVIR